MGSRTNLHILLVPGIREKLSKIEILEHFWLRFYKTCEIYEIKIRTLSEAKKGRKDR